MASAGAAASPLAGFRIVELARQHIGEKYVLGVVVPKDNPTWKGPWDCAEFASWVLFQITGKLYGCSDDSARPAAADAYTGFWQRDAQSMGQVVSVELASRTAGAFVLRTPQPGAVGHVVISDGKGGTIEAHSSKDGVIASALSWRRWDTGIFAPAVQYTPGSAVPLADPVGVIYRLTTPLMTGEKIKEMQCKLQAAGFDTGGLDGVFGPHTHAAVLAFQLASGLAGDGEVGRLTARALRINMHAPTRSSPGRTSGKRRL